MKIIENLPLPCQKGIGAVSRHFPRAILSLRNYIWSHKLINWKNPDTLQEYVSKLIIDAAKDPEKLQSLADMADKVKVREYVRERVGEKYLTKLYGHWKKTSDVDWDALPQKFAIKTNNGCGTNIIVRDKSKLDIADAQRKLGRWMEFPYGQLTGQPHYCAIEPEILAEELLEIDGDSTALPADYKFFCFNGEPKYILYYEGRRVNGHECFNAVYDTNWNPADSSVVKNPVTHTVPRPDSLAEMTEMAKALSKGMTFVRVDMYNINGRPVFGEMTFTPDVTTNFTEEFLTKIMEEIR